MNTKDETITKVVFRKFPNEEVIALFPELFEKNNCCLSYIHIGQHGAASYSLVNDTISATEDEYKSLAEELEAIGYNLKVCKRITRYMKDKAYKDYLKSLLQYLPSAC